MAVMLVGCPLAIASRLALSTTLSLSHSSRFNSLLVRASRSASPPSPSSAEESSAKESASDPLDIPPAAVPTSTSLVARTSSLLSAEGIADLAKVNHYDILQLPLGCSKAEIANAFKDRVKELTSRPKQGDDVAAREQELRALQISFDVLYAEEERRMYDWVLERYRKRSKDEYIWPYETDITQKNISKLEPPMLKSDDEEGNRRVGLFFLIWVIVGFVLSSTLKTWIPTHTHFN